MGMRWGVGVIPLGLLKSNQKIPSTESPSPASLFMRHSAGSRLVEANVTAAGAALRRLRPRGMLHAPPGRRPGSGVDTHDRVRGVAARQIFSALAHDVVEVVEVDVEDSAIFGGDARTCPRAPIWEAGPGVPELGARACAEAAAASAAVADDGSKTAAGLLFFAEYTFASNAGELVAADGDLVAIEPSRERAC